MWFEVAIVMTIFAFGNIFFGHFEERTPKWRRAMKVLVFLGLVLAISSTAGRAWAMSFLGSAVIPFVVIHMWWLPNTASTADRRAERKHLPAARLIGDRCSKRAGHAHVVRRSPMQPGGEDTSNVRQAVPFFRHHRHRGLNTLLRRRPGFKLKQQWAPAGRIRWCWLEHGDAALMLQEHWKDGRPAVRRRPLGQGSRFASCSADAIASITRRSRCGSRRRGRSSAKLWVTPLTDPDGYHLDFESPTDVPEDTVYTDPA